MRNGEHVGMCRRREHGNERSEAAWGRGGGKKIKKKMAPLMKEKPQAQVLDRRGPPLLVYATLPAYLRRTPVHLVHALHDAQMHLRARREARSAARVGAHKADTDAEYDAWAEVLLDTVAADVKAGGAPRLGVLRFGTHNWASCEKIFAGVVHPDQPLADLGRGSLCAS
ncbi:hypothetical protein C8J57DRAFT_1666386 [Mycena rebaudengoi]|nr:hypothetical protein C8J57DRAFT_1666386 [Mycena rebaudengoi]